MRWFSIAVLAILPILCFTAEKTSATDDHIFPTYGVHSTAHRDGCTYPTCVYTRGPGEPSDPWFPPYWTSRFAMYRVFNNYQQHPPPYDAPRMSGLRNGADYQVSYGTSYYDVTWHGRLGVHAMKEHFEHFCLPTFAFPNNYSCSVISLGRWAFFVTYDDDRPSWMPPVCLFSPDNTPPAPNFIRHLPYSISDSARTGYRVQAYSFWTKDDKVAQTGASPDHTPDEILFGFSFYSTPTRDATLRPTPPYRHPHSFYFSGVPLMPGLPAPNAPIVSQNYIDFSATQPNDHTWSEVADLDPTALPRCHLFEGAPAPPDAQHVMTVRSAMGVMQYRQ